jgi:hypothetical protein
MLKNRGVTSVIEYNVYKNVLQRAGWALIRPFLYTYVFFKIKNPGYQTSMSMFRGWFQ